MQSKRLVLIHCPDEAIESEIRAMATDDARTEKEKEFISNYDLHYARNVEASLEYAHSCDLSLVIFQCHKHPVIHHKHCFDKLHTLCQAPILALINQAADVMERISLLGMVEDITTMRPISPVMFRTRVWALLQRFHIPWKVVNSNSGVIVKRGLSIVESTHEVYFHEYPVDLTLSEFSILHLLAANPRQIFTPDMIYEVIRNGAAVTDATKLINNHVQRLKGKLDKYTDIEFIKTVRGMGYRFIT